LDYIDCNLTVCDVCLVIKVRDFIQQMGSS
jgi:hypothetical protein